MMPQIKAIVCTDLNDALYYVDNHGNHVLPSHVHSDIRNLDRAILRKFLQENPPESNLIVGGVNTLKDMGRLLQDYNTFETDSSSIGQERLILSDALRYGKDIIVVGGVSCYNMFAGNYYDVVHVHCQSRILESGTVGKRFIPETLFKEFTNEVLYEDAYVKVQKLWEIGR